MALDFIPLLHGYLHNDYCHLTSRNRSTLMLCLFTCNILCMYCRVKHV